MRLAKWGSFLIISSIYCPNYAESSASSSSLKIDFQIKHYGTHSKDVNFKYPSMIKRDGSDTTTEEIILPNQLTFYIANLTIGNPGQDVAVLIDTGSSDLWIQGSNNPYCERSSSKGDDTDESGSSATTNPDEFATEIDTSTISATQDCDLLGIYNQDDSSSYHSNNTDFEIEYADSTFASGTWGSDQVKFGNFTIKNMSFAVANMSNSSEGVLGIGYQTLESSDQTYLNLPAKLVADGSIKKNSYSLFLNPEDQSGSILFGAVDHSKYTGPLKVLPVLSTNGSPKPSEMLVTLSSVSIKGKNISSDKYATLLDSGTTYSTLPHDLCDSVNAALGASYEENIGTYVTPCGNTNWNISWDFSGATIVVPGSEYLAELLTGKGKPVKDGSGESLCAVTISYGSENPTFGDNFLRSAYVVYDLDSDQIALAQANSNNSDEDIEIISSTIPSAVTAAGYSSSWSGDASETETRYPSSGTYDITETELSFGQSPVSGSSLHTTSQSSSSSGGKTSGINSVIKYHESTNNEKWVIMTTTSLCCLSLVLML